MSTVGQFVHPIEIDGKNCWIKFGGEHKRSRFKRVVNRVLKRLGRFYGNDLRLYSGLSAADRFNNEMQHLKKLNRLGLSSPRLVASSPGYFITECAGQPMARLRGAPNAQLLRQMVGQLLSYHKHGLVHGRPAMRDILVDGAGDVTFVDFEEARVTRSTYLRLRDVLLLLLDSYRVKRVSQQTRLEALRSWKQGVGVDVNRELAKLTRLMNAMDWLPKLVLKFKTNRLSRQALLLTRLLNRYAAS